jgi:hypothetical protein
MNDLIKAYEDYIKMLGEEIDDLVGLAYVHGWRSERIEAGKQCRERIVELKEKLISLTDNRSLI